MRPSPRRAIAIREAGHAVALLHHGIVFERVEVSGSERARGQVHIERPVILPVQADREAFAVVALAGPVAECFYAAYSAEERQQWSREELRRYHVHLGRSRPNTIPRHTRVETTLGSGPETAPRPAQASLRGIPFVSYLFRTSGPTAP